MESWVSSWQQLSLASCSTATAADANKFKDGVIMHVSLCSTQHIVYLGMDRTLGSNPAKSAVLSATSVGLGGTGCPWVCL
jgi:hypothetical protein